MLSLCRKAGKLKIGFEPVKDSIEAGAARLVLFASDFSSKSRERMEKALAKSGDPPESRRVEASMFDLARVCGKQAGVLAITDEGFASGIVSRLCDQTKEEQNR